MNYIKKTLKNRLAENIIITIKIAQMILEIYALCKLLLHFFCRFYSAEIFNSIIELCMLVIKKKLEYHTFNKMKDKNQWGKSIIVPIYIFLRYYHILVI